MKAIFTILAIMVVSATFAQTPEKVVLIPDYSVEYEKKVHQRIVREYKALNLYNKPYTTTDPIPYASRDIFVIGNFNKVNIIRPMMKMPETNVDNNNAEYVKATQFNPNKTLQEILRNDKP